MDPDRERVELRGGPLDGGYIDVGKGVVRTELPWFIEGGEPDPTMHEYVRSDTTVPVFRYNGRIT